MTILVAGLPRSGTTTVAKALEILGYDVVHYCPITNPNTKDHLYSQDYTAYVSSELLLMNPKPKGKWIILHRDKWYESMWKLGEDICEWQEHLKALETMKKDPNNFIYSVEDGWEPLCEFLGIPKPNVEYPFENALTYN